VTIRGGESVATAARSTAARRSWLARLERAGAARWTLLATHEAAARVRAEPFAAVELDLGALWAV
jgi:hypothetical protein